MQGAWNNDKTIRLTAMVRLTAAYEDGQLGRGRLTPFLVLTNGAPLREAETIVGMPVPFAFLFDGIFLGMDSSHAPEWALETCETITRNMNLRNVVPCSMYSLLLSLSKLVADQVERGAGSNDAQAQLAVLEDASEIIRSNMGKELTGQEAEVLQLLRRSGNDPIDYIAKAAVEAVLVRPVSEPKVMLDADKTKSRISRMAYGQSAGMEALSAVRAAADLFAEYAKQVTAASIDGFDQARMRLAEDNARSQFFDGMANGLTELVRLASIDEMPKAA